MKPKILYMGTPVFAVKPLQKLLDAGYPVVGIVTRPDSQRDRGKQMQASPVKRLALEKGLPSIEPERLRRNEEFMQTMHELAPDLIVVAAYGQILPLEILEYPKYGCINIHASLLPRHRGAAPIERAILAGDEMTGITLMYMDEILDTGDIIAKVTTPIDKKTTGELAVELSELGSELLIQELPAIIDGTAKREAQDNIYATYAPPIQKTEAHLDFQMPALQLERLVRAMNPEPGAYCLKGDERLKVLTADIPDICLSESDLEAQPGRVLAVADDGILIATGKGVLRLKTIQLPGRQVMPVSEFLKGNKIEIGSVLE